MPHTSSAKKRARQYAKNRLRNRTAKKDIKLQIRKVDAAVESGSAADLQKEYNIAAMKLDRAAARKIIHRNTAARKKSQLARQLNAKVKAKA